MKPQWLNRLSDLVEKPSEVAIVSNSPARYIETLDSATADEIVNRLVSVLEPG
jgi:hypothetical protein